MSLQFNVIGMQYQNIILYLGMSVASQTTATAKYMIITFIL